MIALAALALAAVLALWLPVSRTPREPRRLTPEELARARARAVDEFRRSRA